MRRDIKFPSTETFEFYNANPKNKFGGDCVIRAIAVANSQSWESTVLSLTEIGIRLGYVCNDKHTFDKYLKDNGWVKMPEPRKFDNTKMSVSEAIKSHLFPNGLAIANVGSHHIVAIKNNKVYDIWDSSKQTLHSYYVRAK